ncbi:MAG: hypothetical protein ACP5RJ_08015, partial [Conexivisphaera sp.]
MVDESEVRLLTKEVKESDDRTLLVIYKIGRRRREGASPTAQSSPEAQRTAGGESHWIEETLSMELPLVEWTGRSPAAVELQLDSGVPAPIRPTSHQLEPVLASFSEPGPPSLELDTGIPSRLPSWMDLGLTPVASSFLTAPGIQVALDSAVGAIAPAAPPALEPVSVAFVERAEVRIELQRELPGSLARAAPAVAGGGGAPEEEGLDPGELERIYGEDLRPLLGAARLLSERAVVISVPKLEGEGEGFLELLKRVLREAYRVRVGGLPEPRHVRDPRDLDSLMLDQVAGGRIAVIDLTGELKGIVEDEGRRGELERLSDRLREIFSQRFGFLVLYGEEGTLKDLPRRWSASLWGWPIMEARPRADRMNLYALVSGLMWGLVDDPGSARLAEVVQLENNFYESLRSGAGFDVLLRTKPSSSPDEAGSGRESMVHYLTKAFVVSHLVRMIEGELRRSGMGEEEARRRALECVETEHVEEGGSLRYDVYVNGNCLSSLGGRGLIVEVETMYGTGTALHKLLETVESRCAGGHGDGLWMVIPNPQAVIYLPELLKLRRHVRVERGCNNVEFYALDLSGEGGRPGGGLVRLTDVARRIMDALGAA